MINRKICLLGAFSVGKTSLVRRFVHEVFDDRYTTTLGTKIETIVVELDSGPVKLVIWDMEGAENADDEADLVTSRMKAYLQGLNGVMLVADGTRAATLETAHRLHQWIKGASPGTPAVLLLNKADLKTQWQMSPQGLEELSESLKCFSTSALSGTNVDKAFLHLAQVLSESK